MLGTKWGGTKFVVTFDNKTFDMQVALQSVQSPQKI